MQKGERKEKAGNKTRRKTEGRREQGMVGRMGF